MSSRNTPLIRAQRSRLTIGTLFSARALLAGSVLICASSAQAQTANEELKLLANDGATGDTLGIAVSISNGIALVGAALDDDNGSNSGSAYLFDTSSGQQIAKLLPNDGAAGDVFGAYVAISGNFAVVGAIRDDDNGTDSGSVYLFDVNSGQQLAKLLPDDGNASDYFGNSVDISGDVVIIGAWGHDANGSNSGAAYLFDLNTGQQIAKLLPDDGAGGDQFGAAVAISGTFALVGALGDDDNGSSSGSAYLFDINTAQQIAKLHPTDADAQDSFGEFVAISAGVGLVGAAGNGDSSGSAYLFDITTGQQVAKLLPSDGQVGDYFGSAVAISGGLAVVGALGNDDNGPNSGSAYLFDVNTGEQLAKLISTDNDAADRFGFAVDVAGGLAVIGARGDSDDTGSAYIFQVCSLTAGQDCEENCAVSGVQWVSGADGFFSDGMNWAGSVPPDTTQSALYWVGPGGSSYVVTFDGSHENKSAFVNDHVTLNLQDGVYGLNEPTCPSLSIGMEDDGAASLTVTEGAILTDSHIVVGGAANAQATLTLQSQVDLTCARDLRVGALVDGVPTGECALNVSANSSVEANKMVIAENGTATIASGSLAKPSLVAVGPSSWLNYPDAVGRLGELSLLSHGVFSTEQLVIDEGGTVTVAGEGALLGEMYDGVPELELLPNSTLLAIHDGVVDAQFVVAAGFMSVASGGMIHVDQLDLLWDPASQVIVTDPDSRFSMGAAQGVAEDVRIDSLVTVTNGGRVEGVGFVCGTESSTVTSVFFEGNGSGTGDTPLDKIVIGDAHGALASMTVSDEASVRVKTMTIGREYSLAQVGVCDNGQLMTGSLVLTNRGQTSLDICNGGKLLLGDLFDPFVSYVSVDFNENFLREDPPEPGDSASITLSGAGSQISAHPDLIPDDVEPISSSLRIAGIGEVHVSNMAQLAIGGARIGFVDDLVEPGGLLVIDNASASFFSNDSDDNVHDFGNEDQLVIGGDGVMRAENAAAVSAHDIRVGYNGELRVKGEGSSLNGTNVLVHGTNFGDTAFLNVDSGGMISLLTLDAVNGAEVVVGDGGHLVTTSARVGGGAFDDEFGPTLYGGNGEAVVAVTSVSSPTSWDVQSLTIGGSGIDPLVADASGEVIISGAQATIVASSIVIEKDGQLNGNGTVIAPNVSLHGGLITARIQSAGSPLAGLSSTNTLLIDGNIDTTDDAVIRTDIAGEQFGQYGVLNVTGDAVINGVVELNFVEGFGPSMGDQFDVLVVGGSSSFGPGMSTQVTGLAPGFDYEVQSDPRTGVLKVTALNDGIWVGNNPCPADIVDSATFQPPPDGLIDGADLAFLLGEWGANPRSPADMVSSATFLPPPDGAVDGADLAVLLGAWGTCN